MKKYIAYPLVLLTLVLTCCGTKTLDPEPVTPDPTPVDPQPEPQPEKTRVEKYKTKTETSLICDSNYRNGFYSYSPKSTEAYVEKTLDYDGKAETDTNGVGERPNYWDMCPWWTPYNFINSVYSKSGDTHIYQNESRYFGINTKTSELTMKLDADMEYKKRFESGTREGNEPWSHFLIQQAFPTDTCLYPATINTAEYGLHAKFDIRIDEAIFKGKTTPVGANCAQLMFYMLLANRPQQESDESQVGKTGLKLWFGVPIYDTRYNFVDKYIGGDTGFEGATGHLIYSMSSKSYMGESKIEFGKTYNVDIDVLDELKEAFIYGAQNHYLENCKWQNMRIEYMNFGWEIPGNYSVSSTVKNMDIYVG